MMIADLHIHSDGRPILGPDCHDLPEMVLDRYTSVSNFNAHSSCETSMFD